MDFLIGLFGQFFDDPQHVEWAIYSISAIAGVTLAISISYLISGVYSPIRSRLKSLNGEKVTKNSQDVTGTLEHGIGEMAKKPFLNFSNHETRRLLIHAGFHSENALAVFNASRLLLILFGFITSLLILNLFPNISGFWTFYIFCLFIGGAFIAPSMGFAITFKTTYAKA